MLWFLNRCVAPFLAGCCAAKSTTVADLGSALVLVALAALFICMSFQVPSRIVARIKRAGDELVAPASEARQQV